MNSELVKTHEIDGFKVVGVRVDEITVGKKLLVRTETHSKDSGGEPYTMEELYAIERHADGGLYISRYGVSGTFGSLSSASVWT
jgi:hypothetical protein